MIDKNSEIANSIDIFSTDDEKLKILAEIISNKPSIEILNVLFNNEMTANELAQKINISLQLVKYHLEKMQRIDLVHVSRVGKNSKSRDMNYYKTSKLAILITPSKITEKAKQSKLLKRSFRSIYRFFGIGITSLVAILSVMSVTAESSLFTPIKNWYSGFEIPISIPGTGLPSTIDETYYLAKTKVDSVVANPGAGSGTPYFDPYTNVLGYTVNDFVITMLVIGAIGVVMSLPFFVMSYRHSKKHPEFTNLAISKNKIVNFKIDNK